MTNIRFAILTFIAIVAIVIFEIQNVWPFNKDKITIMRIVFYISVIFSIFFASLPKYKIYSSVSLLVGFLIVGVISESPLTLMYAIVASLCIIVFIFLCFWRI